MKYSQFTLLFVIGLSVLGVCLGASIHESSEESSENSAPTTCKQFLGLTGCAEKTTPLVGVDSKECQGDKCQSNCCQVEYNVNCPTFQRLVGCPTGSSLVENGDQSKLCMKDQCLALCCNGVARTCAAFLRDQKCPKGSKPSEEATAQCDGDDCKSKCCVPDGATCADWFETTDCMPNEQRTDGFQDITCKDQACAEQCCTELETKTCTSFWKDENCREGTQQNVDYVGATCFGTRCQSVCCMPGNAELTCGAFLDNNNRCDPGTVPVETDGLQNKCNTLNCKQVCCRPAPSTENAKSCRSFFSQFPCASGRSRVEGFESKTCEKAECALECCQQPTPMTCAIFTSESDGAGKNGRCPTGYRPRNIMTDALKQSRCDTFEKCTGLCCTNERKLTCGTFLMNENCPEGTSRQQGMDATPCVHKECHKTCCKKLNCDDKCEDDKVNKNDHEFLEKLTEKLTAEPEPCTGVGCPDDPMKAINMNNQETQKLCVNCQWGSKQALPSREDINVLTPF